MNPFQSIIHLLSDPNVAFILLTLGFYGLLFELQSPNFVTGILGAIALILAFIGFGSLPLNVAGVILIGLAVVLFLLEFTVTSHGLLAVGGLICFVLGAFTLYTAPGSPAAPDVTVARPLILVMTAATAGVPGPRHRDRRPIPADVPCLRGRVRRRGLRASCPVGSEAVVKRGLSPLGRRLRPRRGVDGAGRGRRAGRSGRARAGRRPGRPDAPRRARDDGRARRRRTLRPDGPDPRRSRSSTVIVVLVVVGVGPGPRPRPVDHPSAFGAGGATRVPGRDAGHGQDRPLHRPASCPPSARTGAPGARDGSTIAAGDASVVVGQDGLVAARRARRRQRPAATGATPA